MNSKSKQNLIVLLALVVLVAVTVNNAGWAQSSVDNSEMSCFPPIRDQGTLSSGNDFARTYYQLTHNVGLELGWNNKSEDNTTKFSPKWTYNLFNGGDPTARTTTASNYAALEKHGAATWAEFPYDDNYVEWCLNKSVWRNAIKYRTYPRENLENIATDEGLQQVKQLLNSGYVLVLTGYVDAWQYTTVSNDPSVSEDDVFEGQEVVFWVEGSGSGGVLHAKALVGYNDFIWVDINNNSTADVGEKGALKIANSRGTGWGNDGYMWIAYDALQEVSAVPGGPSSQDRRAAVYSVYHLPVRTDYAPRLLAEITINHANRNHARLYLGVGDADAHQPSALWGPPAFSYLWNRGDCAFDGSTTAVDGTFVFDFTDIMPSDSGEYRYFIQLEDKYLPDPLTLYEFKLVDTETGAEVYSETVPKTAVNNAGKNKGTYAYLNYSLSGNLPPVAQISADPTSGTVPLTVDFDGSGSYDSDGTIVLYSWDFGDGNIATGVNVSHTYTFPGTFTAFLTVTDNDSAEAYDSINITVEQDDPDFIEAPSNLEGTVSSGVVTLTWTDNSDNEEGFYIERGTKAGKSVVYDDVDWVGQDVTTYLDSPGSGRYYYRVQAFNMSTLRVSEYSNEINLRVK